MVEERFSQPSTLFSFGNFFFLKELGPQIDKIDGIAEEAIGNLTRMKYGRINVENLLAMVSMYFMVSSAATAMQSP